MVYVDHYLLSHPSNKSIFDGIEVLTFLDAVERWLERLHGMFLYHAPY